MKSLWLASPLPLFTLVATLACAEGKSQPQAASPRTTPAKAKENAMSFHLTSSAFAAGADIPAKFTCQGADHSPPLQWSGTPSGTKSLALIVDDPDAPDPAAPKVTWVHWVLYGLPADAKVLPEGAKPPHGAREGLNDWKQTGWRGPCPPVGEHRYFFKLYALDALLPDLAKPNKAALEKAMEGHVLARAELMGRYQKH